MIKFIKLLNSGTQLDVQHLSLPSLGSHKRASWRIFIIIPIRCTNISILFLEWNSTCFRQYFCPSSGVFHCTHNKGLCHKVLLTAFEQDPSVLILLASCLQTCMTNTIAVFTVKNSWWWTEELSETCRVSFQK